MVVGTPAPSHEFAEALKEPASEELWKPIQARASRREAESEFGQILEAVRPAWNEMADATAEGAPTTLTLRAAQVWPLNGGDGTALAAVRVPIHAVTTWWCGGGRRLKARSDATWWFGITVPLG